MYIRQSGDSAVIYTISSLKRDNPNVSFPRDIPDELLAEFNVFPAVEKAPPAYDKRTQYINKKAPEVENGVWCVGFEVLGKAPENIEFYDMEKAAEVRIERNRRLDKTDWTQVADAPVDQAAWATYRQALRDIPDQEGFPNTMDWPVEP